MELILNYAEVLYTVAIRVLPGTRFPPAKCGSNSASELSEGMQQGPLCLGSIERTNLKECR